MEKYNEEFFNTTHELLKKYREQKVIIEALYNIIDKQQEEIKLLKNNNDNN